MAQITQQIIPVAVQVAPTGACANGSPPRMVVSTGIIYSCQAGTWGTVGSGGATFPATKGVVCNTSTTASNSCSASVLASSIKNPVAGASAEYPMLDGSGTTVTDVSGNGNNAVFSSSPPTWLSYGLSFSDEGFIIATPQVVNTPITTLRSFYIAHCTANIGQNSGTAFGGAALVSQFQPFTGTSSSAGGLNLYGGGGSINSIISPILAVVTIPGFTTTTQLPSAVGGCHVYGWSITSPTDSKDHLTIDGVEQPSYLLQGSSSANAAIPSPGFYQIGTDAFLNGLRGVVSYAVYFPTAHTIAQMQQETAYIQAQLNLRPTFPRYPVLNNAVTPQLIFVGDSLTAGFEGSSQWTAAVTPNLTYTVTNLGVQSLSAVDACALSAQRWAQQTVSGQSTIFVWAGTNDFGYGFSAAQIWQSLSSCVAKAHALGSRIVISTMISANGRDANKDLLNPLIRSQWQAVGFDGLDDLASVAALGGDGASSNTACFQSDGTHLTGPGSGTCAIVGSIDLTGYGIVAALASNTINTLDGSNQDNPTLTSSNAFVSAPANNFTVQTPTAAGTYALVDCQGQSMPRTLVNGSGTFTITVSAINSQTITGLAAVLANTTAKFTPVLISPTAGGCRWQRTQ